MKANLDQPYMYMGKVYGPGEADVPDNFLENQDLAPAFRAAIEGNDELSDKLGENNANLLKDNGYEDADSVRNASDEELLAVDGIGEAKLAKIRSDLGQSSE